MDYLFAFDYFNQRNIVKFSLNLKQDVQSKYVCLNGIGDQYTRENRRIKSWRYRFDKKSKDHGDLSVSTPPRNRAYV